MQKTMVWRGLDYSLLLSVLSLRATSTHSSTDLEKMKLCCFLSMMNEMMQQSVRSPTPCADGSESLHRNKSISVCHIKTDDICRRHLECMSCVYDFGFDDICRRHLECMSCVGPRGDMTV